jgi:hypothetical protein
MKSGSAPKSGASEQRERAEPKGKDGKKSGTTGRASDERSEPRGKDTKKSGTSGQAGERADPKGKERADPKGKDKAGTTGQGTDQKAPAQKSTQPSGTRTDATASISTEQRTRIRETVMKQSNAPRVDRVDFRVSVGTVVPRSVRVVALPASVVEIHPAWRGFLYFIVGDEIVIVQPGTLRIVAVLPA